MPFSRGRRSPIRGSIRCRGATHGSDPPHAPHDEGHDAPPRPHPAAGTRWRRARKHCTQYLHEFLGKYTLGPTEELIATLETVLSKNRSWTWNVSAVHLAGLATAAPLAAGLSWVACHKDIMTTS